MLGFSPLEVLAVVLVSVSIGVAVPFAIWAIFGAA